MALRDKALDSIAAVTRERDVESMEWSLAVSMAQLLPCREVALYRIDPDGDPEQVDEVARTHALEPTEVPPPPLQVPRRLPRMEAFAGLSFDSSQVARRSEKDPGTLVAPIRADGRVVGALRISGLEAGESHDDIVIAVVRIFGNFLTVLRDSERDKLTGLLNRRTFEMKLDRLLRQQRLLQQQYCAAADNLRRGERPCDSWLAVVDIDHFKRVNDTYGHVIGDEVLLLLSRLMRDCFRNSDLLFRFGGEEFVLVLEPLPDDAVGKVLDRLRRTVEAQDFPQVGRVTVSVGYARLGPSDYPQSVIERADQALYYAKDHGRNRCCDYHQLVALGEIEEQVHASSVDLF